jgi:hypothetical protein
MGDRGSLEPAARDGVRPLAWALVVNVLSVHVVTVARTSGRCRPPGRRTLARRVTLAEYALRRTPTTNPAATLCPVQRPRLTFGARVGRRWAAVREPVLDTCVAALLWAGMAVDLATRPLTEGQSPTSPVAYVVTGLVAAPVVVHRRYPVLAMLLSTTALVGYSLGRFTAYPGYTTFVLVFLVALHADRRRALVVYLGGVVGLSVSLLLQPPAVATAGPLGDPPVTKPERIAENLDVFDFDLSDDDLAGIDALDTGRRGGPEPADITLETFGREIPEEGQARHR